MMQLNRGLSVGQNRRTPSINFSVSYEKDTTKHSEARKCPVSNNGFGSFLFRMVLVGHGFINCLASESLVVSFS